MLEIINKLMAYSFSSNGEEHGPGGFLFFFFLLAIGVIIIWVSYYFFDCVKSVFEQIVKWRKNSAEYKAQGRKNNMAPKIMDAQVDLNFKIDKLTEELREGITHLSQKNGKG